LIFEKIVVLVMAMMVVSEVLPLLIGPLCLQKIAADDLLSKSGMKPNTLQVLLVKWHDQFNIDNLNEKGSNLFL